MSSPKIPLHDFSRDDSSSIPFRIEPLEQKTEYDDRIPHRHNYYEIFLWEKGGGVHDIDFESLPISTYCIQFISPGVIHHVRRELDSHGYVIYFSRDFYYLNMADKDLLFEMPFLNNNTTRPQIDLPESDFLFFKQIFDAVQKEYNGNAEHKEEVIRSYLNIILVECRRRFDGSRDEMMFKDKSSLKLFRDFKVLLEKNFVECHQVQDYAGMLAITDKYLNELSKKTVGMTASELIHDRIVLEARRLLLHSDLSNKEVAFHLKFEDPSHFSKFFKKKTGYTPTDFRTMVREKYGWNY